MSDMLDKVMEDPELKAEILEMIASEVALGVAIYKKSQLGVKKEKNVKVLKPDCFGEYPEVPGRACRTCRFALACKRESKGKKGGKGPKGKGKKESSGKDSGKDPEGKGKKEPGGKDPGKNEGSDT